MSDLKELVKQAADTEAVKLFMPEEVGVAVLEIVRGQIAEGAWDNDTRLQLVRRGAIAALRALEAAGVVVPKEPTPRMLDAAQRAHPGFSNEHIAAHYRAMLAAAPPVGGDEP